VWELSGSEEKGGGPEKSKCRRKKVGKRIGLHSGGGRKGLYRGTGQRQRFPSLGRGKKQGERREGKKYPYPAERRKEVGKQDRSSSENWGWKVSAPLGGQGLQDSLHNKNKKGDTGQ